MDIEKLRLEFGKATNEQKFQLFYKLQDRLTAAESDVEHYKAHAAKMAVMYDNQIEKLCGKVKHGQSCFIGSRYVGKFVGINPDSGSYVTVSDYGEYRGFHDYQLGFDK